MGRHETMRRQRTPRMEMGVPAVVQVETLAPQMNPMAHFLASDITCASVDERMSRDDNSTHVVVVVYNILIKLLRQGAYVARTCLLRE